jgi:DNA-binding FadR family transcriptional regulator
LLHESVQESLKAYIAENGLVPGTALPAEGDLALQLGVSRGSVREAIRALESLGIVESRRGIGVFVAAFSFAPLLDNLVFGLRESPFDTGRAPGREVAEVLQIRRVLEVGLVAEALQAATPDDIDALRAITDRMRASALKGESFAAEDQLFHQTLFRKLGNVTLLQLLDVFWMAFFKASHDITLANNDPMATWRDHDAIVDALAAGDIDGLRTRLDLHYDGIAVVLARRSAPNSFTN